MWKSYAKGMGQILTTELCYQIKCISKRDSPTYLKLRETLFFTRRQARIGKFFNDARGKIGMQNRHKWLKFMGEINVDGTHKPQPLDSSIGKYYFNHATF